MVHSTKGQLGHCSLWWDTSINPIADKAEAGLHVTRLGFRTNQQSDNVQMQKNEVEPDLCKMISRWVID